MRRFFFAGIASVVFLAGLSPAAAKDSPGPDRQFLGVDVHKGKYLDQEYVAPGADLTGKTIQVEKFALAGERPEKEKGDLSWKELPEFMQTAVVENAGDRTGGQVKFSKSAGSYKLIGQVTEFRPPSAGASWGGWIGEAAGSGTIVFDFKIVDGSGKVVAAAHHKLLAQASDSLRRRVENVSSDEISHFMATLTK